MAEHRTRLYLVRHGAHTGREGAFPGSEDPGLSPEGEGQVRLLASRLTRERIDALYASDLKRAAESAVILGSRLGIDPVFEPALRELDVGRWAGLDLDQIEEDSPGAFQKWCDNPESFRPPGGESLMEMAQRVLAKTEELLAAHQGRTLVVVAHGGPNRVILADALGLDPKRGFSLAQDLACLNIIDYYDDGTRVVKLLNGTGEGAQIAMEPGEKVILLGGARSGKSDLALSLAEGIEGRRYFLATAQPLDEEMALRIEAHKERRGEEWETVEEPVGVLAALKDIPEGSVVVLDCLTLWLSNLLHSSENDPEGPRRMVESLAEAVPSLPFTLIMVTNEVGTGIVPGDPLSRAFRDLSGYANRRVAEAADRAFYIVAGLPVVLK